jgi:sugar (pentulose or hexulose) kinase
MKSIILIVDAGSSSIRCTAHKYHGIVKSQSTRITPRILEIDDNYDDVEARDATLSTPPSNLVEALSGIGHTIPLNAIVPSSGHIRVHEVLDAIDDCVDKTLKSLRQNIHNPHPTASSGDGSVVRCHRVVAIGFSSFVMNLVAVDINGDPVGEVATCSYACNREDVVRECEQLKA